MWINWTFECVNKNIFSHNKKMSSETISGKKKKKKCYRYFCINVLNKHCIKTLLYKMQEDKIPNMECTNQVYEKLQYCGTLHILRKF